MNNNNFNPNPSTCPRCGAQFSCGIAVGEERCWCFDLPNVIPLTSIGEGCLCPDCLQAVIETSKKE